MGRLPASYQRWRPHDEAEWLERVECHIIKLAPTYHTGVGSGGGEGKACNAHLFRISFVCRSRLWLKGVRVHRDQCTVDLRAHGARSGRQSIDAMDNHTISTEVKALCGGGSGRPGRELHSASGGRATKETKM